MKDPNQSNPAIEDTTIEGASVNAATANALLENLLNAHKRLCGDLCSKLDDPEDIAMFTKEIKALTEYINGFARQQAWLIRLVIEED